MAQSEKYEVFVQVLTRQVTQRVDALAAAVPGEAGKSAEQVELEAARRNIDCPTRDHTKPSDRCAVDDHCGNADSTRVERSPGAMSLAAAAP